MITIFVIFTASEKDILPLCAAKNKSRIDERDE